MIEFSWPICFLLLPLPILLSLFSKQSSQNASSTHTVWLPFFERIQTSDSSTSLHKKWFPNIDIVILWCIWLLLIIAIARPEEVKHNTQIPLEARDLMLAVDLSGSMNEKDMALQNKRVTRLEALKVLLSQFIEQRQGDRIGLIVFADTAYLHAPLTFDIHTIRTYLQETQLGFAGRSTAIGDAIGLAIKKLEKRQTKQKILILATDGSNTSGKVDPIAAAKVAKTHNLKIYTIGIGGDNKAQSQGSILNQLFNGSNSGIELDEKTLQSIANITGARYFRAKTSSDLRTIYSTINALEPIEQKPKEYKIKRALFYIPLFFAFLLSVVLYLKNTTLILNTLSHLKRKRTLS